MDSMINVDVIQHLDLFMPLNVANATLESFFGREGNAINNPGVRGAVGHGTNAVWLTRWSGDDVVAAELFDGLTLGPRRRHHRFRFKDIVRWFHTSAFNVVVFLQVRIHVAFPPISETAKSALKNFDETFFRLAGGRTQLTLRTTKRRRG